MRHFKKRTIALCLASVITVLGSFGANAYNNSLVDLHVNNTTNGKVSITAYMEKPYTKTITTEQTGNNSYIITFPSSYSTIESMPDITSCENIESLQISTFPTTPNSEGYTQVSVKTKGNPLITANASLYIKDKSLAVPKTLSTTNVNVKQDFSKPDIPSATQDEKQSYWDSYTFENKNTEQTDTNSDTSPETQSPDISVENNDIMQTAEENFPIDYNTVSTDRTKERFIVIIGTFLVLIMVFFIYFLSKDKMASVVGEQLDMNFDDEKNAAKTGNKSKTKQKNNKRNIKRTINKLDKKYKNINKTSKINIVTGETIEKEMAAEPKEIKSPEVNNVEEVQVVDIDALYNEKQNAADNKFQENNEQEKDDLAIFLHDFSSDEIEEDDEDNDNFDEELYEKTIKNQNINFSNDDKSKLSKLMLNEISDDTLDHIKDYAPSKESENRKRPTKIEKLENLVAEYAIKQNLSFAKDDIDTIQKLMNVELDESFVKDLRTDREHTIKMQLEMMQREERPRKPSEIITLKVKDVLPDLSKELAKQGNKQIKSEAKPEVVYFSEGYDVSTLSVSKDVADITEKLKFQQDSFRPSDTLPISESGYDVDTLSIKDELPDLEDVKKNPKKYEEQSVKQEIDEEALLQSISNVTFKPFYEESNPPQDIIEEPEVTAPINNSEEQIEDKTIVIPKTIQSRKEDDAQQLLKLIEQQQARRQEKRDKQKDDNFKKELFEASSKNKESKVQDVAKFNFNGQDYTLIKTALCSPNSQCKLLQLGNKYYVVGIIADKCIELKTYESLNTTNMQIRLNDKNNPEQYLVKIGTHKFCIKVTENNMEFIMDLC